jgi:hypothetical protein
LPVRSNTLSVVLAMPRVSFRRYVRHNLPRGDPRKRALCVAAVLLLAGCGGSSSANEQTVRGTGYRFSAPAGWTVKRAARAVQVSQGIGVVSVTRYELLRAYRPALWDHVVPELDRAAQGVAEQQKGRVAASRTITLAGRRARSYDIAYSSEGKNLVERISFVLRGKTEYYLLCRYEGGGDTGACDRLLATFALG